MPGVVINISSSIGTPNAIIQKFGETLYTEALPFINNNTPVTFDFEGIKNLTSGFCNASIGRLFLEFPSTAESLLNFANLNKNSLWQEKVEDSIRLAKNPEESKLYDSALASLEYVFQDTKLMKHQLPYHLQTLSKTWQHLSHEGH